MRRALESEKEWSCVTKCRQLMLSACLPRKHAGSDPEAFWLRPVKAVTASVRSESGRIVSAGSDFPHPIQFRFSKEGMDHIVWNRSWSDLGGRVWPNASGLEASWCAGIIRPGFWKDATRPLPIFYFQTRLQSSTDVADHTVQNQPRSDLALADCQVLAKQTRSGSKSGLQKSSGPLLANTSKPIRIGCESDPACLLAAKSSKEGRNMTFGFGHDSCTWGLDLL